jgi:conserved domain protein
MKLSEIIEVFVAGDWGNESQTKDTPYAVSCVRGADIVPIQNNEFRDIPLRYISLRSFQNKLLQEGDIVIEKSGGSPTQATGRAVYISKELLSATRSMVCSNFCVAFRVKQGWNPYFVYQYWQHLYNRKIFFNFEGKTSGIKNLQLDIVLSTIEIEPYSVEEQNAIARQLQLIEQKIGLNRAINHNLEEMAKQLYDYWFVQFDYPNKNGKSYKSSGGTMTYNENLKRYIPENWHCGNLFEIATFTNGLACQKFRPKDGEVPLPVIKIREMHDGISSDTEDVSPNIPESVKVYNGDVLFSWSASLEVMLWAYGLGGLNQHIFKVTSANDFPKSFYYFQLLNYVDVFKKMAEARKTTMGHITQDHLRQSTIAIPDDKDIAAKFEKRISPIFARIVKLQEEIQQLSKLRDELLPLLMNGQVSPLNCD